jgi:iron complex outermembrane receptor protein
VLIDGVPIGTPLRDGRRDIRSLSLSVIESVEVIRGASALYGNGGAGGVINYITKKGGGENAFESEVGAQVSATHFSDSFSPFARQSAVGRLGPVNFVFDGYVESTKSQFDAEGDRIRPSPNAQGGLADSLIYNVFGKLGTKFGEHRIDGSLLYYKQVQDSDFNGVITGSTALGLKTRVFKAPRAAGSVKEGNSNFVANLVYSHGDVFGSNVRLQGYYQKYENIFSFDPGFFFGGGQSIIQSKKRGARLDINTPFSLGFIENGSILWGADYGNDETGQPLADGRIYAHAAAHGRADGQGRLPLRGYQGEQRGLHHGPARAPLEGAADCGPGRQPQLYRQGFQRGYCV